MPQLSFDLERRERSAARVDDQLAAVAVSQTRRAVIWMMITHPKSNPVPGRPGELCVALSYRQAGEWLNTHASRFAAMGLGKSNLARAVKAWKTSGVMTAHSQAGRPTLVVLSIDRLVEWHNAETLATDLALESWRTDSTPDQPVAEPVAEPVPARDQASQSVPARARPCPPVPARARPCPPVPASEREERERIKTLSLNSEAVTPGHAVSLPDLPEGVENVAAGKELRSLLVEWWNAHDLKAAGFVAVDVVGAILAARTNGPGNWKVYIEKCLANGVRQDYRTKAKRLIDPASAHAESRPYSPHGLPQ